MAAGCYTKALNIKHTRAHQGLASLYHLKNQRKEAYDEITKLTEKAPNMSQCDLSLATDLDHYRTYPYRYKAAVLMDDKENEAIEELAKEISFKPDLQLLHLRAAFYDSMGEGASAIKDCEAVLCNPGHADTFDLYHKVGETNATDQK